MRYAFIDQHHDSYPLQMLCIALPGNGMVSRKYGNRFAMKTTIEGPDSLFSKAKSRAAERGQTLKECVTDALQARLATERESDRPGESPWMGGFGRLQHLRKETARIQGVIDEAFDRIETEDRL